MEQFLDFTKVTDPVEKIHKGIDFLKANHDSVFRGAGSACAKVKMSIKDVSTKDADAKEVLTHFFDNTIEALRSGEYEGKTADQHNAVLRLIWPQNFSISD